ncbi:CDGSH iron-sulfur domain-containing protein [Streptomyces sp. NPDC001728]|uniref:CDGSH iron-sulfur domain-containing protein n=1 Tax=Streptomyces sp. NPDC001728 TaxID=3154396 RepID=UPI003330BB2C
MPGNPDDTPRPAPARRVSVDPRGPVLVEGPVEIVLDDGTVVRSDRFSVAVCTCRRSRTYPWCDTSHRRRGRTARPAEGKKSGERSNQNKKAQEVTEQNRSTQDRPS